MIRPETERANHEHVEVSLKRIRRTAPEHVARCREDLWLGVKGLTSSEIAGFPRKLFK
jgi:hypothetical protein